MTGRPSRSWLWILVGSATLSQATVHLIRPITTYKLVELEAGGVTVGAITGLYALLPLVLALTLGARTQRAASLKPLLIVGSLITTVGASLVALAETVLFVALGSALLGLGQLVFTIAGQAAITRFATDDQLDMAFGWFTAGFSAGQMLGPLVGGGMLSIPVASSGISHPVRIDLALWIGAILSLVAAALLQFSGRSFYQRHPQGTERAQTPDNAGKPTVLKILKVDHIKSHLVASIAMLAILDVLSAFLPLLGEELNVSPVWVGGLLAVRAGASIVSRLLLPVFRRHFSRQALIVASLLVAGSTLAVSPLILDRLWVAVPLFAVAGFILGMGQPLTMSAVTEAVPIPWRSSALALRLMGNRFGQVSVPVIAGVAAAPLGPAGAIWTACLVLLVSGTEKALRGRE